MLQQDYYRELLDIQNCGLMAYTLPKHRLIHMNAEALRMYQCSDIEEAQQNIENFEEALLSGPGYGFQTDKAS